jgi:hypothetical protein
MQMFHCTNCDAYFQVDFLATLPGGLRVHRCGQIPQRLTRGESKGFADLVAEHEQPSLQCIPKRRRHG